MSEQEHCFWCLREGRSKVPATKDGGRFGPLCNQCANDLAVIILDGMR